jgi:hypothetical protein
MSRDHSKEVLMDKVRSFCYSPELSTSDPTRPRLQAHSTFISRDQVAALLREHIQSNTIKVREYRMRCLSTASRR